MNRKKLICRTVRAQQLHTKWQSWRANKRLAEVMAKHFWARCALENALWQRLKSENPNYPGGKVITDVFIYDH